MNAIILAGGRGSRLEPWHEPKTLLPVNGVPMLMWILDHIKGSVRCAVICTGYGADAIKRAIRRWDLIGISVLLSDAGEDADMGARLAQAHKLLVSNPATDDDGRVLVLYGDELADVDIAKLLAAHQFLENIITFAAAYQRTPGGMVFNKEKPVKIVDGQRILVNIGFAIIEPKCWELLKPDDGLSDFINRVSEHGLSVGVYHHEGKRVTVNSLQDLKFAKEMWK